MVFIQQIVAEKKALVWYLRTYSKLSFRKIAEECGISKSSAHRIYSNEFGNGRKTRILSDKRQGRPRNYNPKSGAASNRARAWRKREEGLKVTAKGCKDLAGGRRLHVLVAIAYGKGVILKVPYQKMTGEFFATFIREHFNMTFANAGPKADGRRLFVMDNDPSQTSRVAKVALEEIEGSFHEIPPRSPDLNPIENIFHLVKRYLDQEAISRNITRESFDEFNLRVLEAFRNIPLETIDKTISSMNTRITAIVASKGERTKY
ncbi:uncharacterized protein [Montipora capricornis]|uniref:uncharacterized protein n=1 Tax=Montipora capricornis TaxID=246305 RepID=UPI0035F203BB